MIRTIAAVGTASLVLTILPAAALAGPQAERHHPGAPAPRGPVTRTSRRTATVATTSATTTSGSATSPDTDRLAGRGHDQRPEHPGPVAVQPRLRRPHGPRHHCRRRPAAWSRDRPRADGRPREGAEGPPAVHRAGPVRRGAGAARRTARAPGFLPTDDGFVIAGQPHVAANWFPVSDHPTDKAAYTFRVTVPRDRGRRERRPGERATGSAAGPPGPGRLATRWRATWPRSTWASATSTPTGRAGSATSTRSTPTCSTPWQPRRPAPSSRCRSGTRSYKRLLRTIDVPAGGATVDFTISRAHRGRLGLRLRRGPHRSAATSGPRCPTRTATPPRTPATPACSGRTSTRSSATTTMTVDLDAETCEPTDGDGEWWAARAAAAVPSSGWSTSRRTPAARSSCRSATRATTPCSSPASFVDDMVVSTGRGLDVVRERLRRLDRARRTGGQPRQRQRLDRRHRRRRPAPGGRVRRRRRSPGSRRSSGSSPASSGRTRGARAGGIVDDIEGLGFALETQTRPIYSKGFFTDPSPSDGVVVHELAHQWYGDSLAVAPVEGHLAQRGVRDVRRVAVAGARGPRHRAGELRLLLQRLHPGGRPVVGHHDR